MQIFKPPRPSNRRNKILVFGESGSGKTTLSLQFPKIAYCDNHGSSEKYEAAYPDHLFAHPRNADETIDAVKFLLQNPGDRRTFVLDDMTIFWTQLQEKWVDLFLKRLPRSKGHKADFYQTQPSDWVHIKRDLNSFIQRIIALDMNVVVIARAQREYAGEGDNFMKVVGTTFGGEKNLPYSFDFIFELKHEGNKRIAITHKQRIAPGSKPLPDQFEFTIDDHGRATFYDFFKDFSVPEHLTQEAHIVEDPVTTPEINEQPEPQETLPAPSVPPVIDFTTPATGDQFSQIKALKDQIKFDKKGWETLLLQEFKVKTATALNYSEANRLVKFLQTYQNDIPF